MLTESSKKRLHIYKDRLNIILDVAQTINQDHTIEDLLAGFKILLKEELEVGKVLVYTYSNNSWKNLLSMGVSDNEREQIDVEQDLIQYKTIENITLSHPPQLKGFDAVIPLFHRYKEIGYVLIGDVEEEQTGISPTIKHLKLIQIISNLIIVFIENKRMQNALLEQEALKREMQLAARIQNQLIPNDKKLPVYANLELKAFYQPHFGIGGDYYDIIKLSPYKIGFCIADVSGKGVGAAILMSNFQAIIRSLFTATIDLPSLVHKLNERVNDSANNEKFITLFIGRYNTLTRRLTYINAGHLPPIFFDGKKNQIIHLEKGCIGLGMLDFIPHIDVGRMTVPRKSKLMAFTDGLVELERNQMVETDVLELEHIINQRHPIADDMAEIKTRVAELVREGSVFDDIALIAMGFL
ncbi:sigma-B regulation protein RsbU (phosphoserine phosphatase) [Breznakibacter xylanolyticus]|uniref:Sigma-B regulation protein RsbU (Phosphoserine phosphatase) n=1 Tax=Breznakibacter xylanolyticus TaxID=990 RepID=A0A2W7NGE3_9BACT|nr:SpoIIE family protein phosphatase [Breznakibacter xylanolyticus]MBN2742963.1 SpoIIE family protein phosphatase [Marinilabiliaceae bacterium]PZX19481.1 sigma-B regulation protein RsbU (phosphoserine phosphatase) [Breznakibacter xylanolyticus]